MGSDRRCSSANTHLPSERHSVCLAYTKIKSLSHPHDDLPSDMQMFAQLIVNKNIILQTVPVATEPSQNFWKLKPECKIPEHVDSFVLAIMRHSETRGTQLLGSIGIGKGEALNSAENDTPMSLKLEKVNLDGPLLKLTANFWVSQALITSVDGTFQAVVHDLLQLNDDSQKRSQPNTLVLWLIHERILFQPASTDRRGRLLDQLGDICLKRWKGSQVIDHLRQGIYAYTDAVRDDPGNPTHLEDLGIALFHCFQQLGDVNDIHRAVSVMEDAVHLTRDGHPDKAGRLSNLGNFLQARFERLGDLNGHPDKPAMVNNLGNSLRARFGRLGDLSDLNESVSKKKDAVHLTPDGHPDKPGRLNNLGTSLGARFERFGDLSDLNEWASRALVNNLGNSLRARFGRLGDLSDLNESVSKKKEAVHLTPDGHPDKPGRLNNLGNSLRARFERLGDLSDLNESVSKMEDAVHLTPDGHPDKPAMLGLSDLVTSVTSMSLYQSSNMLFI
ncbi:hypothetical protein B0H14DRAFT_3747180 [Mycena olivaceomarginata]|nr:hypothetical protein B0H14DRAFT_3747180 [Mycena olivaceomarginata]